MSFGQNFSGKNASSSMTLTNCLFPLQLWFRQECSPSWDNRNLKDTLWFWRGATSSKLFEISDYGRLLVTCTSSSIVFALHLPPHTHTHTHIYLKSNVSDQDCCHISLQVAEFLKYSRKKENFFKVVYHERICGKKRKFRRRKWETGLRKWMLVSYSF